MPPPEREGGVFPGTPELCRSFSAGTHKSVSSALCRAMSCGMLLRSGVPAAHLGLPKCSAYIHDCDVCFDHFNEATFSINTAP